MQSLRSPEYFYPLYKEEDKKAYKLIVKTANKRDYPKLLGSESEINEFLKLMVYSERQKIIGSFGI